MNVLVIMCGLKTFCDLSNSYIKSLLLMSSIEIKSMQALPNVEGVVYCAKKLATVRWQKNPITLLLLTARLLNFVKVCMCETIV